MSREMENKLRLERARRASLRKRFQKADRHGSKKRLYGNKEEKKEADRLSGYFKKEKNITKEFGKAKKMASAPARIQASDIPIYGTAMILAMLKDILDLSFIGSLPGIGTVITFCVSIAIGFILLFDGISSFQRKVARRLTRKLLVLMAGTLIEGLLFGLNFLPFEMITVAIIYWISLSERRG